MPELPSGTVTLLFTDIEGSTQLLRRLGDAYARVLSNHHRLLRHAFAAHHGHEVDAQGDSLFVAFSQPISTVSIEPWSLMDSRRCRCATVMLRSRPRFAKQ